MSASTPEQLAKAMKDGRNILVMTGSLCDEMEFGQKKLSDYAAELALKLDAPIAAGANTVNALRTKGARVTKKVAIEIVEMLRYDEWRDKVLSNRPDLLVFIGFTRSVAQALAASASSTQTVNLGTAEIAEATYSLPDQSQAEFERALKSILKAL